ncbi:MAG: hypothetical protein O2779_02120 [Nanoarchaeota archaeon]|nr:hypothetical protein [Nanoarchaeota archaeon]
MTQPQHPFYQLPFSELSWALTLIPNVDRITALKIAMGAHPGDHVATVAIQTIEHGVAAICRNTNFFWGRVEVKPFNKNDPQRDVNNTTLRARLNAVLQEYHIRLDYPYKITGWWLFNKSITITSEEQMLAKRTQQFSKEEIREILKKVAPIMQNREVIAQINLAYNEHEDWTKKNRTKMGKL